MRDMDLEERILEVELLTEALMAALAVGDDDACARLGDERGNALASLGEVATRDPSGVARMRDRLQALREADGRLQQAAEAALAETGALLQAANARAARRPSHVDAAPRPSGLDRRA